MRYKQALQRLVAGVLLGGAVFGAQAQSTGPLAVEERSFDDGQASSSSGGANGTSQDGIYMLMQQMQQYDERIAKLQGQIEELRHQVDTLKAGERERYLDLDTRINSLVEQIQDAPKTDAEAGDDGGSTDGPADPEADRAAYSAAKGKLLERDFDAAASAFESYLKDYPQGQFRAHAHFWLGEVYSNQKQPQLSKARQQFQAVLDKYPNHGKAPTSLYKLASLDARAGNTAQAKVALNQLVKQFPDSSEAELAKSMLKQLNGG
ncbi:tol-pal system protein YbgF [Alloalcanivorax mobilis]|uniref:tol-pal system protein YbgF n=1 Tax=Alloalcanivorax mobilis TaxID=2019569 RepID=UPI000B5B4854|nr:tol-pal system protein YbgF [Alloalcanivorax mobilis]ASK34624.1 tol-pal system protein YbgF [Alcanivorax sp. N3-2A]|tara:strand:- start:1609 stop:2397 length:789 start_codon:yes stop_codon:yes gene_type:complete